MNGNAVMAQLATAMAAALTTRIVTRSVVDFQQRAPADRRKGVITIFAAGVDNLKATREIADAAGSLQIFVMGEFELAERTAGIAIQGEDIEAAEWAMWAEIAEFIKAPGAGLCPLDAVKLTLSGQTKLPEGWILAQLEYSELEY